MIIFNLSQFFFLFTRQKLHEGQVFSSTHNLFTISSEEYNKRGGQQ